MGAFFIGGQLYEYAELVREGLTIASSPYGSVFYLTTGFHGLHVIGGLIAFLFVLGRSFGAKRFGHHEATTAIVVSYYWHFVDVVWIALFAVIYLLPVTAPASRPTGTPHPFHPALPDPRDEDPSVKALAARRHHRSRRSCCSCWRCWSPAACTPRSRRARPERPRPRAERHRDRLRSSSRRNCATCHGMNAEGTAGRAVADRRRRRVRRLPGRHRPHADAGQRPAGAGQAAAVHRGADRGPGGLRRLARARAGDPHRGAGRPRAGRPGQRHGALPDQLRDVPQRRRRRRRAVGGQVRARRCGTARPTVIYEAMLTGPQSMPVFNDANITPEEKRDIIAYLVAQRDGSPGGAELGVARPGDRGPVGLGRRHRPAHRRSVWIGAKSS